MGMVDLSRIQLVHEVGWRPAPCTRCLLAGAFTEPVSQMGFDGLMPELAGERDIQPRSRTYSGTVQQQLSGPVKMPQRSAS
jgi:hypothetical protein